MIALTELRMPYDCACQKMTSALKFSHAF